MTCFRKSFNKYLPILVFFFAILCGCNFSDNKPEKYKIGFSQCTFNTEWRKNMNNNMLTEALLSKNIDLIIKNANDNSQQQIKDIQELLRSDIDLLIVSPNEEEPLTPVIEKAFKSGIKVILLDRKIKSDNYSVFIGADNYIIGKSAAQLVAGLKIQNPEILELWGQTGSSPAKARHQGFADELKQFSEITIDTAIACDWNKDIAYRKTKDIFTKNKNYNIIYSHNDEMAIGAFNALKELNLENKVKIIGIDALASDNGGIKAVIDKKLFATFLYPDGGEIAIRTAIKLLQKNIVPKEIKLNTVKIDSTNAIALHDQMLLTKEQQNQISRQTKLIDSQLDQIHIQQLVLVLVIVFLFIFGIMFFLIYRLFKKIKKNNKLLNLQNIEINSQKEELNTQAAYLAEINNKLKAEKEQTTASIKYAQTIQNAILPNPVKMSKYLNNFIIYLPKDIVSGDFYWYHTDKTTDNKDIFIFAVVDCTGHGVPGAFMSLIGTSILNEIIKQKKVFSTSEILNQLHNKVQIALKQDESDNDDGMEAVICAFYRENDTVYLLKYEGAKLHVLYFNSDIGSIETLKTTRKSIGGKCRKRVSGVEFCEKEISVKKNDRIYLTSDGISDQNNNNRLRFGTEHLIEIIEKSANQNIENQKNLILSEINNYMKGTQQRDDITLLGIEI